MAGDRVCCMFVAGTGVAYDVVGGAMCFGGTVVVDELLKKPVCGIEDDANPTVVDLALPVSAEVRCPLTKVPTVAGGDDNALTVPVEVKGGIVCPLLLFRITVGGGTVVLCIVDGGNVVVEVFEEKNPDGTRVDAWVAVAALPLPVNAFVVVVAIGCPVKDAFTTVLVWVVVGVAVVPGMPKPTPTRCGVGTLVLGGM